MLINNSILTRTRLFLLKGVFDYLFKTKMRLHLHLLVALSFSFILTSCSFKNKETLTLPSTSAAGNNNSPSPGGGGGGGGGGSSIHGPLPTIGSVALTMTSSATTSMVGPYTLYTGGVSTPTIHVANVNAGNRIRLYAWDALSGGPYLCTTPSAEQVATSTAEDLLLTPALANGYWIVVTVLDDGSGTNTGCPTITDVTSQLVPFVYYHLQAMATDPTGITLVYPSTSTSYNPRPTVQVSGVTSGDTVTVYSDASCTTAVGSTTATATTANVTLSTSLSPGASTLYAKRTTAASVSSNCSSASLAYTVQAPTGALPAQASITVAINGVGAPANYGGGLFVYSGAIDKPVLTVGSLNAGNRVKIYMWAGAGPYTCTTQVGEGGADGASVDIQLTTATTGTVIYVPVVDDGAGNDTGCPLVSNFPTIPYAYYVYTPPVAAPTGLARQTPSTATGRSTTPTIRVSGVTNGNTVRLFTDSSCSTQVATGTATGATIDLTTSTLTSAAYTFYANQSDASSTSSCSTASVAYTVNTTMTAPSSLTLYSPSSSPDADPNPVITVGGVVSGDTINLYTDSNCSTLVGTATASSTTVDVSLTSALTTDGTFNYYAKAVNGALSSSCSTAHVQYVRNSYLAPITAMTLTSPSSNRALNTNITVHVTGVASGDTVRYYTDSSCTSLLQVDYPTGSTIDSTLALTAGDATWDIYATRDNGNYHSACSTATVRYYVDTGGTVSVNAMSRVLTEGAGAQTLQINLSAAKSYNVTVYLNTVGTNATSGVHYSMAATSVTIPAGQTSANVSYSILENALADGEKYLQINIEGTNYPDLITVSPNNSFRQIIRDNDSGALGSVLSVSALGGYEVCAIVTGGVLKCWGAEDSPTVIDSGVTYTKVSVYGTSYCAITTAGVLKCWGNNFSYQVGDGTNVNRSTPVVIDAGTSYVDVSMGSIHACGVTTAGVLKCWGNTNAGLDSRGNVSVPTVVPVTGVLFQSVAVGLYSSCAISTTNDLYCWGALSGQYSTGWGFGFINQYDPVFIGAGYAKVNVSDYFFGIKTNGDLYCGGCSNNVFAIVDSGVSYSDAAGVNSGGYGYFVGLTSAGVLKAWGNNSFGMMGPLGNYYGAASMTVIDSNVSQFSFGLSVLCAIKNSVLVCSSPSSNKVLGLGFTILTGGFNNGLSLSPMGINATPTVVMSSISNFTVSTGDWSSSDYSNACAVDLSGYLSCWGYSTPDGTTNPRMAPVRIDRSNTYSKILSYANMHAAIKTSGGVSYKSSSANSFQALDSSTVYTDISAAYASSLNDGYVFCGLTNGNAIKCWGYHGSGGGPYFGNGDTSAAYVYSPTVIDSGVSYASLASGYEVRSYICGITTAGVLKCWGMTDLISNSSNYIAVPTVVDSGTLYTKASLSSGYMCGVTTVGDLKCWGVSTVFNSATTTPTVVDSGVSYQDVVLGRVYGCGITVAGALKCWGLRADTGASYIATPTDVDVGVAYSKVVISNSYSAANTSSACAITTTGVLKCWGAGTYGIIGDGTANSAQNPTVVDSGTTYLDVQLSQNGKQVCAITTGHVLKCWGSNAYGGLGYGQTTSRLWNRPVNLE